MCFLTAVSLSRAVTYMMHHQTLMFFSLMGTVSVSVGAWCIALARVFWEQYGESIFFAANGVQVPAECYAW
jgi:hypothetical protein